MIGAQISGASLRLTSRRNTPARRSAREGGQRFLVNQDLTTLNDRLSNDAKNR